MESIGRCLTLYGFIPRTLCAERVSSLMPGSLRGDGDPLDICVISERPIYRNEILVNARVIGGLPMCDHGEADDKIVAVIEDDPIWSKVDDISEMPQALIDRLMHYFLTYKLEPNKPQNVTIGNPYGFEHAASVIEAAIADYHEEFGANPEKRKIAT